MATYKIYKLHFTAPLHIGDTHEEEGYSLKTIHSDTLYAALTSCLAKTNYQIPENGDLGFTVSSLFPYYQHTAEDQPVYFLPMPLQTQQAELTDVSMAKKIKKVQWIDSNLFGLVLKGISLFDGTDKYLPAIQESYLTTTQLPEDINGSKDFIRSEVSQRVTLQSRVGEEDARPFYVDKILFRYHAGLYFIAEGNTDLLKKALDILSIEGIGTDRNVGFGFFEYSEDSINIDLPEDANHQLALSILIPENKEQLSMLMESDKVAYDFQRRGGWITTYPYQALRKNAIYGFVPGSVFNKGESSCCPIGKIVNLKPEVGDLTPDHPIWRYGKAIMLPINFK